MALLNYKEAQTNFKQILRKVARRQGHAGELETVCELLEKKKESFERAVAGNEKSLVIYHVDYDGMLNVEVMDRARVRNQLARERKRRILPVHDQDLQGRWETPKKARFAIVAKVHELCRPEYQGLVSDILRQYFRLRMTLVKIHIEKHGPMTFDKDVKSKSVDSIDIVQYCQRSISQYKRLWGMTMTYSARTWR
ncbi:hypothetical protein HF325_000241 [Metschnikowia pulcherrima]|uniref:Uncharacterized protein n=1 Tax=Metschnikowia pulcherrima TaxID=27326 RepID=A0A8H7LDS6_9ASCO|nr:hypothetical protein HF325_000241 [Metschnikowia pulcherrima]